MEARWPDYAFINYDDPWGAAVDAGLWSYSTMAPNKWASTLNWRYNAAGKIPTFTDAEVLDALNRATAQWSAVCNVNFAYQGTTTTAPSMGSSDNQNVTGWTALTGGTVGRAQVWWSGSTMFEFDVVLDNEQPYQLTTLTLLEAVATHEFGHSIGMNHTTVSPAIMSPSVSTNSLVQDDIDGCVSLYGAPAPPTSPVASLSRTSVPFGNQEVGTTSAVQSVRLTNSGGGTLTLASFSMSGAQAAEFSRAGTCTTSSALTAGQFCDLTFTFAPLATGARSASLGIATNASGSPHTVSLSGTGTLAPVASLSATSLAFGNQEVGTTSASRTVRLTNSGGGTLTIASLTLSGAQSAEFTRSGTCTTSSALGAGQFCDLAFTFTPQAAGTRTSSLAIATNASGSPHSVALSGTGVLLPKVSLSPASLGFGNQSVSTTSAVQSVRLTNSGAATLNVSGLALSGLNAADFSRTGTCTASTALPSGQFCDLDLTFTPQAAGARSASLVITTDAAGSPHSVALSGTGTLPPTVSLNPASLAFGVQQVGTSSAALTVRLANVGGGTLTVTGLSLTGAEAAEFARAGTCSTTSALTAGQFCDVAITFTPQAAGLRSASLVITTNASGSPHSTPLSGTGTLPPAVSLTPSALLFGSQQVSTLSAAQTVRLTNSGGGTLSVTGLSLTGSNAAEFNRAGTCSTSSALTAGQFCDVAISFLPQAAGARSASLVITTNASGSPHTVPLSGTGTVPPTVSLNPTALVFAAQLVGTTSATMSARLTNSGGGTLSISGLSLGGAQAADFSRAGTCSTSSALTAGQFCDVEITFTPSAAGARSASVSIASNVSGSPHSVPLSGTGTLPPTVLLNPSSLSFGTQQVGTSSAAQTVRLTNSGGGTLTLAGFSMSGAQAAEFSRAGNCTTSSALTAGQFCDLAFTFTPQAAGTRAASLAITSNASAGTAAVSLAGVGAVVDAGVLDAGAADAGTEADAGVDAGSADAGSADAGVPDAGTGPDAGTTDAGEPDAGSDDGGEDDAGSNDGGEADAGSDDGGEDDAGSDDGGEADAGGTVPTTPDGGRSDAGAGNADGGEDPSGDGPVLGGCGCGSTDVGALWMAALGLLPTLRRRVRR